MKPLLDTRDNQRIVAAEKQPLSYLKCPIFQSKNIIGTLVIKAKSHSKTKTKSWPGGYKTSVQSQTQNKTQ